jgi:hypothetical protein
VGYYSTKKKNEVMSLAGKWMELEIMILGEINQAQNSHISCFHSFMELNLKHDGDNGTWT